MWMALAMFCGSVAAASAAAAESVDLASGDLALHGVEVSQTRFSGSPALRLRHESGAGIALLTGSDFADGVIEVEVAGTIDPEASLLTRFFARGFVGLAFRVEPDLSAYERIYLRPTNARSDDQLRRNHSTQYDSPPDHPWSRLRDESPGKYESYVDLEPGVWTRMRIVVSGETAELHVGDAEQPALVIGDLRRGKAAGKIGLWVGPGTVGYFRNLRIQNGGPVAGSERP